MDRFRLIDNGLFFFLINHPRGGCRIAPKGGNQVGQFFELKMRLKTLKNHNHRLKGTGFSIFNTDAPIQLTSAQTVRSDAVFNNEIPVRVSYLKPNFCFWFCLSFPEA